MKLSKQQLADIFDDAADFDGSNEQAVYARKALLAGTLEIEGYEKAERTKFNKDDPNTFPPVGSFLGYFANDQRNEFQDVCFREPEDTDDAFACPEIHFWRPLPPPPGKEEAK